MARTQKAFGKRKREAAQSGSKPRPRVEKQYAARSTARASRAVTRATTRLSLLDDDDDGDFEEDEGADEEYDKQEEIGEDMEDDETDEPTSDALQLVSLPRLPPKVIHSEKLPILLSLYYGPQKQTGETLFLLSQISSLAEVRSCLFKHFFWEFKRAGVPADLGFIRANCFAPDLDGPCDGAWPIGTAEGYDDWINRLRREEWKQGQFARVQIVAVTDKNMQRMESWGWQGHGILEPAFWLKKRWLSPWVDEMEGTKWVANAGPNDATDGSEWGLE